MSTAQICLHVIQGSCTGEKFVFADPTRCIIGRAHDCDIRLPQGFEDADASRHHCELEIDPPTVRVRDLGSRNGTYVNGYHIGQRLSSQLPEQVDLRGFEARTLHDGDELRVGHTVFRVEVAGALSVAEAVTPHMHARSDHPR